jgi:hypothetical protein
MHAGRRLKDLMVELGGRWVNYHIVVFPSDGHIITEKMTAAMEQAYAPLRRVEFSVSSLGPIKRILRFRSKMSEH